MNDLPTCAFCSNTRGFTKEHIIPEWLLAELGIANDKIRAAPSFLSLRGQDRELFSRRLVFGRVCKACNEGWMSQLETAVMPVLKLLLPRDAALVGASMNLSLGARPLSLWVLKTAGMLNLGTDYRKIIPAAHIAGVKQGVLPSHTFVSAGFCATSAVSWCQSQQFMWLGSAGPAVPEPSYKVSFQFGHLLLQVAHLAGGERDADTFRSISLWPEFKVARPGYLFEDIHHFDVHGAYVIP